MAGLKDIQKKPVLTNTNNRKASEANVTIVTSKKPRFPDPILDKYREEGILGAKPGMVAVKGKEVTLDVAGELAEKTVQEKLVSDEDTKRRKREELLSDTRRMLEMQVENATKQIRSFWKIGAVIMGMGASLVVLALPQKSWWLSVPLYAAGGLILFAATVRIAMTFDKPDVVWSRKRRTAAMAGIRVLDAFEKGEKISDDALKAAVAMCRDSNILNCNYYGEELHDCFKKLEDEGSAEAAELYGRMSAVLNEKLYDAKKRRERNIGRM